MQVIEYRASGDVKDFQVSQVLQHRLGPGYKVELGEEWHASRARSELYRFAVVTVRTNDFVRTNLKLIDRDGRRFLRLWPDTASHGLYWFVRLTIPLTYIPYTILIWLCSRSLQRAVVSTLVPEDWTAETKADLQPMQGLDDGPPKLYSGRDAFWLAYPTVGTSAFFFWDVGRLLAGLGLLVGIAVWATPELFRTRYYGFAGYQPSLIAASVGIGLALWLLIGGSLAMLKSRLAPPLICGIVLAGAVGYYAIAIPSGAKAYWTSEETTLWEQAQHRADSFDEYRSIVPGQFKRAEAFPIWIASLEYTLAKTSDKSEVRFRLKELLADIEVQSDEDATMQSLKRRASDLRVMVQEGKLADMSAEYFELWVQWLERPDVVRRKSQAEFLLGGIKNFHTANHDVQALKPRLEAIVSASRD